MNRPEEALQRSVAAFLDIALPEDAVWWHTPNQRGGRSLAENKILKAMGVKSGFPDVAIFWKGQLYCIELKAPRKYFSSAQKEMRARLLQAGAAYGKEKRSLDEVISHLKWMGIPLKARAA